MEKKHVHNQYSSFFARLFSNCSPNTIQYDHTQYRRSEGFISRLLQQIGKMPGEYSITPDHNFPVVQCVRQRVPLEGKEKKEVQLKEMATQDIITLQVDLPPRGSSLTYPHKANGTLGTLLDHKDLCKAIICEHHKALTLKEITNKLADSTTCFTLDAKKVFSQCHMHPFICNKGIYGK